jgi:hypothetical protein
MQHIEQIKVKPAPDRRVRKPDGVLLEEAGETVERSSYWMRRLRDGDVVQVETKKGAK